MVCDPCFISQISVKAKWPGSGHDSRILRDSHLCTLFERGKENFKYQTHGITYTYAENCIFPLYR